MSEKRRRSWQDTQDTLAEGNRSGDISLAARTQSGSGPEGRASTFMLRFLLRHIFFDRGLGGHGPDEPRLQGNLLWRKDWIHLREIALSEWVLLLVEEVAAYPWCAECDHLRSGICLEERQTKWAHVGWSPWYRRAGQIGGPCAGRPDSSTDSEVRARVCLGLDILLHVLIRAPWYWPGSPLIKSELAFSQHGNEDRKSDSGSGHSMIMRQKQRAITHSVATHNTISTSPMVLQCSLPAVVHNPPSAAFWFDHEPRPTESRIGRDEETDLSGHAGCRFSRFLRGVCAEGETRSHLARPSLLHITL